MVLRVTKIARMGGPTGGWDTPSEVTQRRQLKFLELSRGCDEIVNKKRPKLEMEMQNVRPSR